MLTIGQKFPQFSKTACVSIEKGKEFETLTSDYLVNEDNVWTVMFWWPKDFTFVCPTEIAEFNKSFGEFRDRDARLIGASTDTEFVHLAWRNNHDDLKDLPFPMLADIKRDLCGQLGIIDPEGGVAQRATFLVDPNNTIQFVYVTAGSVGRNPAEGLRVLDALQTDELCPCNWTK